MTRIAKALISVSDKTDVAEFAKGLTELGIEIISTGGTACVLAAEGISAREVSDVTGSPEILDGRVKTLHPRIHGALLSRPENEAHVATLERERIEPINMVVVNLYPFESTVAAAGITIGKALEQIDIGGVALLRAGAKNFDHVAVVSSPDQYGMILDLLRKHDCELPSEVLRSLAVDAFARTRDYDRAIHGYLAGAVSETDAQTDTFPDRLTIDYEKVRGLRYGENPHQSAAFYREAATRLGPSIADAEQLSGKELSYNNIMDLDAALAIVRDFTEPACAVIKHATPCGVATAASLSDAYDHAYNCDPVSAFGSIVALNRRVDTHTATLMHETHFLEAIVAPEYDPEGLEVMKKKKNRRVLRVDFPNEKRYAAESGRQHRSIIGGLLVQDLDAGFPEETDLRVVTRRAPTEKELASLLFAWRVVKHVRSNAIVLARGTETVGIGAGQMSRVDSSVIAVWKAGDRVKDSVLASDAFFPMRDAVEAAAEAGVTAIIQPGGSKGDSEAIAAADELGVAMVMTGRRHFRH